VSGSRNPIKRHPLIAFFVLAYAVGWGFWPFGSVQSRSYSIGPPVQSPSFPNSTRVLPLRTRAWRASAVSVRRRSSYALRRCPRGTASAFPAGSLKRGAITWERIWRLTSAWSDQVRRRSLGVSGRPCRGVGPTTSRDQTVSRNSPSRNVLPSTSGPSPTKNAVTVTKRATFTTCACGQAAALPRPRSGS
jgi:hypothetical protein